MLDVEGAGVVDLIDAAYDMDVDEQVWLERVLKALMAIAGSDSAAYFPLQTSYRADGSFHQHLSGDVAFVGPDPVWSPGTIDAINDAPFAETLFGRTQAATVSQATGLGPRVPELPVWRDCWREPVVDSLGLIARDTDGHGFCACAGLAATLELSPRETRLLMRLATHLGAGHRLRRPKQDAPLDKAEAILSVEGRLLHLDGSAKTRRKALDEGRRRRDVALKTKHDPEKALEIWQGLVAGRWSLVDHFDTDGKRFILAMKNAPAVDPRANLTPHERRTTALAAMGHRDKEIAYTLGVSPASVIAALYRARKKLGVGTRAELAAIWRRPSRT